MWQENNVGVTKELSNSGKKIKIKPQLLNGKEKNPSQDTLSQLLCLSALLMFLFCKCMGQVFQLRNYHLQAHPFQKNSWDCNLSGFSTKSFQCACST